MNSIICQIPILGKFKKIKGPCMTNQSIASLIMHILDHIKEDQEQNLVQLVQFLSVTIFQGPGKTNTPYI